MEDKITSLQNEWVKKVVALQNKSERDKKGLVILEGEKLIQGALEAGAEIVKIFTTEDTVAPSGMQKTDKIVVVNDKVMKKISTTTTPPKVLALAKKPSWKLDDAKKIILLDEIKDAGNLGTIIRTACAFGLDAVLLFGDCVDEFSPKVLRSSVGCAFKIPVIRIDKKGVVALKTDYCLISTVVNSQNKISDVNFLKPYILMFGSEAKGLCGELKALQDFDFTLPMKNSVESLNLAMSVGVCLWEASKSF